MQAGLQADDRRPEPRFELAAYLPFRLARAAQAVSALVAATCEARFGLSIPAWRILCALAEDGALNLRQLAFRTAQDETAARDAAGVLMIRGLIARAAAEHDYEITPAGVEAHLELAVLAQAAQAALLAGLSPAEVRSLHRLLARVQAAAEKLAPG